MGGGGEWGGDSVTNEKRKPKKISALALAVSKKKTNSATCGF